MEAKRNCGRRKLKGRDGLWKVEGRKKLLTKGELRKEGCKEFRNMEKEDRNS
jgi:hypothetical protein